MPAAVVLTVTVTGTLVVVDVKVAELGLKLLQVAPAGRPEHEKVTVPVNPFTAMAVTVKLPESPDSLL